MHTISRCKALLILPIAILLIASGAWARTGGEVTVFAIGTSRIVNGDMAAGREEAVNNGLIMAVSRALTDTLPMSIVVGHFQVLSETVLNHTDQFVSDYKVLTESTASDTYRLVVQATISVDRLKGAIKAAGLPLREVPYPHVLLCVAEKQLNELSPQYWWSGRPVSLSPVSGPVLAKIIADKGFLMIKPDSGSAPANYPPELSAAEAMDLGQRFKAEVVVAGLAEVDQADIGTTPTGVPSYRAQLHAIAYRTVDGQVLAQVEKTVSAEPGGAADSGTLLREAAEQAGQELSTKLADAWFKQVSLGTGIEIRLQGITGNISDFVKFRGALSGITGVDNLQLREMTSGTAVLTATYQGSTSALGDAVKQLTFDTFRIDVVRAEGNTLELRLEPR
jgi:hypothetical protein